MSPNIDLSIPLPEIQQGSDLFFQAAIRYGYRYVFGNPGTTEAPFVSALTRYPQLRYLLFLHENSATGAADGVARLTGWPAIVNLHLGPGLSNGLADVHNARRAQTPMIVTVGQHHVRHLIEDSPLDSDIERLASVECKWTWTVKDAGELADALYRATIVALTPPAGPVCLILPTNVLTAAPRTPDGRIPSIPSLQIPTIGPAPRQDLAKAVVALLEAKKPTLLVGGNIDTEANKYTLELAQACHARIVRDYGARRIDSPLLTETIGLPYFLKERRDFFKETDLLLLIGIDSFTTHFFYENDPAPILAEGTQVIHLTDNREALGKNLRGSFPLYGDISSTLAQGAALVREHQKQGQEQAARKTDTLPTSPNVSTRQETRTPHTHDLIDSTALAQALRQCLPNKTILVDESVTASQTLLQYLLDEHSPVTTYMGMKGAAIGGSVPVALGAQLAAPDQQVVATTGDGSVMYSIQILWTAAHYHLPLLIVVCNNASYDIVKLELLRIQGTHSPLDSSLLNTFVNLGEPRLNFAHLASGMGVYGHAVQKQADLIPALQSALKICAQGAPALVDVHMSTIFPPQ
jgi:benzoylformate decarboxylase